MRVYLDNCCFNRPFDDQGSLTIRIETEAKLDIQDKIKNGLISLGWSYILDFENRANPFVERQIEILRWKELASFYTDETDSILCKMDELVGIGLKPIDALHVACAVYMKCDYFITVDKGILKKSNEISSVKVVSPIALISEWD
ncbi:PIN domain-containing protein [Desulfatiferula olefinivorans]